MTIDGDRIAPVTWLFGEPERGAADTTAPELDRSPSVVPPAASRQEPQRDASAPDRRGDRPDGRFERINNVSMNALARRGISAAEMVDLLVKRGFERHEVDAECERLIGVGLLDDQALAETLLRTLTQRKGLGRSALTAELRRRKLDATAIETALAELDTDDELTRALELAERRAPQLRSLDAETARRRLGAFLMRKGYSGSVVSTAVARALAPSGGPVFR